MIEQILSTLSSDAFWSVNKKLALKIGIEETVLLSELIYRYKYFRDSKKLWCGQAFYATTSDLQTSLGVSKKATERIIKSLVKSRVVSIELHGVPAKKYWYIEWQRLNELLSEADTSRCTQTGSSNCDENGSSSCTQNGSSSCTNFGSTGCHQTGSTIYKKNKHKKEHKKELEKMNKEKKELEIELSKQQQQHNEPQKTFAEMKAELIETVKKLAEKTKLPIEMDAW